MKLRKVTVENTHLLPLKTYIKSGVVVVGVTGNR